MLNLLQNNATLVATHWNQDASNISGWIILGGGMSIFLAGMGWLAWTYYKSAPSHKDVGVGEGTGNFVDHSAQVTLDVFPISPKILYNNSK